jgi:hypothetical protein
METPETAVKCAYGRKGEDPGHPRNQPNSHLSRRCASVQCTLSFREERPRCGTPPRAMPSEEEPVGRGLQHEGSSARGAVGTAFWSERWSDSTSREAPVATPLKSTRRVLAAAGTSARSQAVVVGQERRQVEDVRQHVVEGRRRAAENENECLCLQRQYLSALIVNATPGRRAWQFRVGWRRSDRGETLDSRGGCWPIGIVSLGVGVGVNSRRSRTVGQSQARLTSA